MSLYGVVVDYLWSGSIKTNSPIPQLIEMSFVNLQSTIANLVSFPELWVQYIPESFTKKVKREDYNKNCNARYEGKPGRIKDEILAV